MRSLHWQLPAAVSSGRVGVTGIRFEVRVGFPDFTIRARVNVVSIWTASWSSECANIKRSFQLHDLSVTTFFWLQVCICTNLSSLT